MTLEMIKQYVEKYLALITSAGTFVTMSILMCIANKVNNGGFFTFKNPNNAIVQKFNYEISNKYEQNVKDANDKKQEIKGKYEGLIKESVFQNSISGVTDATGNKLTGGFIEKLKKVNSGKSATLGSLSNNATYDNLIGSIGNKPYKSKEEFMADVNKIKNEELEKVKTEEIDLESFKFDNTNFKFENGKLALKDKDKR